LHHCYRPIPHVILRTKSNIQGDIVMKKYALLLLLIAPTTNLCTRTTHVKNDLKATTFNVTHANKNDWKKRKPGVCKLIKDINADIYGLQEVIKDKHQLKTIRQILPQHGFIGKPRSSGIKGLSLWHRLVMKFAQDEYDPIFYNKHKLELVAHNTFGINGNGWTSALLPRICTWAHFKEKGTNKYFYVYNTHLDHKDEDRRTMQIKIILNHVAKHKNNHPTIIMGDFNTEFAKDMEKTLTAAGFTLAKTVAAHTQGPQATHEKSSNKKLIACDHICIKPATDFKVKLYEVIGAMGETTSDHNPVCMTFGLK
jgi:endonuclease/exonuclease/phosphatase family metal-dependent hydrolase